MSNLKEKKLKPKISLVSQNIFKKLNATWKMQPKILGTKHCTPLPPKKKNKAKKKELNFLQYHVALWLW